MLLVCAFSVLLFFGGCMACNVASHPDLTRRASSLILLTGAALGAWGVARAIWP